MKDKIIQILKEVPAIKSGKVSVSFGVLVISDINKINKLNVVYIKSHIHGQIFFSFLGQTDEEFSTNLLQADLKMVDITEIETHLAGIDYTDWKNIKFEYKREMK